MSELEARFRVRLEGKDELEKFFEKGKRDVADFQKAIATAFRDSGKEIAGFAYQTSKSLMTMATGNIGIAAQAKNVLEFRDSVRQLAVSAGQGEEALTGLREQIHATAKGANQLQDSVTEALAAFVEKTGDIETAKRNLMEYGKVATATGAAMKDVALVGVELSDKLKIKDQAQSFAILSAQSKAGAVELRDLATKGPRIFAAAANAGATGELGLREAGALAQTYARAFGGKGSAASVATAVENTFASIAKKQDKLEAAGIQVRGRDQFEVLKDIIRKTGGDDAALRHIFTIQAMRGVSVLAREYRDTHGSFATFDKFRDIAADPASIDRDFAVRRAGGAAALKASQISVAASADRNLGDSFERLALRADKLAAVFDFATQHLGITAGVAVSAILAKNLGGNFLNLGIKAIGGAQPVYIAGAAPGVGLGMHGVESQASRFGTLAAASFSVLAAASIGATIGMILDEKFGISDKVAKYSGDVTGQSTSRILDEGDAHYAQGRKNLALRREREARIRYYEGTGMSHGEAINAADQIAEAVRQMTVKSQIVVNINGDQAEAANDSGTHAPNVTVRRGKMKLFGGGRQ